MSDDEMAPTGRKPVPGGILPNVADAMAAYSREQTDTGVGGDRDLLAEVRRRNYEPDSYEIEMLGNAAIWTPDIVRRLMVVLEALESVGVPYVFDFEHDKAGTPVSFTEVKIGLTGD